MAVIGDVLVKLVADFAEFSKGMQESSKQLDDFAKRGAAASESIAGAFELLKKGVAALGIAEVFHRISEEADKVQANVLKIADAADSLKVGTNDLQALQQAAREAGTGANDAASMFGRFQQQLTAASRGNKDAIDYFNKLGIQILDAQGKVRSASDVFTEFAQKIRNLPATQQGVLQDALLGKSGTSVDALLSKAAVGFDRLSDSARKAGVYIDESVIEKMRVLQQRTEEAQQRWDAFWAPIVADAKLSGLEAANNLIESIKTSLEATKPYESLLDKALAYLNTNRGQPQKTDAATGLPEGLTDTVAIVSGQTGELRDKTASLMETWRNGLDQVQQKNDELAHQAIEMNERLVEMVRQYGFADARVQDMIVSQGNLNKAIADGARQAGDLATALINAQIGGPQAPPPVTARDFGLDHFGKRTQPTPTPATGGGGKSDADDIEAITKRYQAMRKSAEDAAAAVRTNQQADIDDLARIVQAKQETQDILARIAQHKTIPPELQKALEDAIFGAKQAQAETQKSIQYNQQAFELEKRLGDGTVAYTRALRDLSREKATGRLSEEAYNRALKEQTEAIQNAALAAKRYDDDLGSLGAGFEQAANQYARAHDLFTAGGQIFAGITSAMDEGLDVLAGKSSKTFDQIASDFALMLAKMALQAAASQVFKTIFAGLSGTGYVPASTGVVFPDVGALIGSLGTPTPRAGGGDVYPGNVYRLGEYGPERFVPAVAGRIEPTAAASMASGGVTVNIDMGQQQGASDPGQALEFGRRVRAAVVDVIQGEKRPGGTLYVRKSA